MKVYELHIDSGDGGLARNELFINKSSAYLEAIKEVFNQIGCYADRLSSYINSLIASCIRSLKKRGSADIFDVHIHIRERDLEYRAKNL